MPNIAGLTQKATPTAADLVPIGDTAVTGTPLKYTSAGALTDVRVAGYTVDTTPDVADATLVRKADGSLHRVPHPAMLQVVRGEISAAAYGLSPTGTASNNRDALLAAFAAFGVAGGTLFLPPGVFDIDVTGGLDWTGSASVQRNFRAIVGAGLATILNLVGTATEGLRSVNGSGLLLRDFQIQAPSTVQRVVHFTVNPNSSESILVENVNVFGGVNGVVVGADTINDVSELTFVKVKVASCANAAFLLGNGTVGNVLDIRCFGCEARSSTYGVYMNGATLQWYGGTALQNSDTDFYMNQPSSSPVVIDGVRSEQSGRFWYYSNFISFGIPVSLKNIIIPLFYVANGRAIVHHGAGPLHLENIHIRNGPVPAIIDAYNSTTRPLMLIADNVATDNTNPYSTETTGTTVIRSIRNAGLLVTADGTLTPLAGVNTVHHDVLQVTPISNSLTPAFNALLASEHVCNLNGFNCTSSTIINPTTGQKLTLTWKQDATGSRTYVWPTNCKFAAATAPTASTGANRADSVTFMYDGTNWIERSRAINVG